MVIKVKVKNSSYNVIIEKGVINCLNEHISSNGKTLVLTDSGVPQIYAKTVADNFACPFIYVLPQGEQSKNVNNYQAILSFMLENGFTRKDRLIAVGGGVVGDLGGFVASTYMRGIDFYNVPTTFLAQVDSSIGGKVAIDFGGVKNSVGAFYQPKGVFIDTVTLETLPDRILYSGLVESIKMAATSDAKLFEYIENCASVRENLEHIIYNSLLIKKDVVEKDEKEHDLRRVLNFGHTIGHAVESYFNGKLYHGECVGIGMLCMSSDTVKERIYKLLTKFGLPAEVQAEPRALLDIAMHDKKSIGDLVVGVYVDKIGYFTLTNLDANEISRIVERFL